MTHHNDHHSTGLNDGSATTTKSTIASRATPLYLQVAIVGAFFSLIAPDSFAIAAEPTAKQREFFESRIRPVLVAQCYECHNSAGTDEGGLIVDHRAGLRKGGDSGPAIDLKNPAQSRLLKVMRHEIEGLEMPQGAARLPDRVLADFEAWLRDGAPDPRDTPPEEEELAAATSWDTILEKRKKWWSLQPISNPALPEGDPTWSEHPVDRFLIERQRSEGLEPVDDADRASLIRRLTLLLTGLPPTIEEIEAFEQDQRPDAYEHLVDRLLASDAFGERWARHWMDWVRYAETHGSEGDPTIPFAWRYRDYLIRALNQDVPVDQLIVEHLAGDLLTEPRVNDELGINESALGTAQYRFVQHGFAPTDALDEQVRFTDNQIDVVTKAFLGLTVSCARCHNHKFDAISQTDFYALYGMFASCRPAIIDVNDRTRQQPVRNELKQIKTEIRHGLAEAWRTAAANVSTQLLSPSSPVWTEAINEAGDPTHPLHIWKELRSRKGDEFEEGWAGFVKQYAASLTRLEERQRWTDENGWHLGDEEDAAEWHRHGAGLEAEFPTKAGAFAVLPQGDRIVDAIYPGGVYSHLTTTRDSAILSSPRLEFDTPHIYVRLQGNEGARARYVVQNYPRRGTVYPIQILNDGNSKWIRWDLSYWQGEHGYLEFSTAADQPVEFDGSKTRSWFGVTDVIRLTPEQIASGVQPRNEMAEFVSPLLRIEGTAPKTAEELAERYVTALTTCIEAFANDTLSDAQARFLNAFVTNGLLPTTTQELPAVAELASRYRNREATLPTPTRAPGLLEADPFDQPLFVRGNHKQPDEIVPRRFLEALDAEPYQPQDSGRLHLARDVVGPDNPLTSRVLVNRIWHHVFGTGIVATPDNFGNMGRLPTHPELLDWLARRFMENGWSLKQTVRFLVTSRTFRLGSTPSEQAREVDPANAFLSHMSVRRMEAEVLRDSLLALSGRLDRTAFGPPVGQNVPRRSIYLSVRRNNMSPFLTVFDMPVPFSTQGRRDVTNVPGQSLTLMNDPFVIGLATTWSQQLVSQDRPRSDRLGEMVRAALGRPAAPQEVQQLESFFSHMVETHRSIQEQVAAQKARLHAAQSERAAILATAESRLDGDSSEPAVTSNDVPPPIAAWSFDQGLEDEIGGLHGRAEGNAVIRGGALVLDGSSYVVAGPLRRDLTTKTLSAWVMLDNLEQRGGGIVSVQTKNGVVFDAIVFGEKTPRQWLAGSDHFHRTRDFAGATSETDVTERPVHVAITYDANGTITGYRNGDPYGAGYPSSGPVHFKSGDTLITFGLRHLPAGGNRYLKGRILSASLFDRSLKPDEIARLAADPPRYVSPEDLLAALTPVERDRMTQVEAEIAQLEAALKAVPQDRLPTADARAWRDVALALFNLKEFLYIR